MRHEFVEHIPDRLESGVLYVSIRFSTVVHKCGCGCGSEVVTPLSPTDWKLSFDGESVSLYPSVGNWNFPCQSHYWIINNKIEWAERWSRRRIAQTRTRDRANKTEYYRERFTRPEFHGTSQDSSDSGGKLDEIDRRKR